MRDEIRSQLLPAFEAESRDHILAMRGLLATGGGEGGDLSRRAHSLKGAARAMELPVTERLAHSLESLFLVLEAGGATERHLLLAGRAVDALEDCAAAALEGRPEPAADALLATLEALSGASSSPAPDGSPPLAPPAAVSSPPPAGETAMASVRVRADRLDGVYRGLVELGPALARQDVLASRLLGLRDGVQALLQRRSGPVPPAAAGDLLAELEDLVRMQEEALWISRQTVEALTDDLRGLRLVAADSVFGGYGRTLRELARAEGKEVDVEMRGLDIEADRTILQRLGEPVLHLLRNAIAHGIEPPAERVAVGKRAAGRVTLAVTVVGGRLRVGVADDGRGLNRDAIIRRAVQQGLIGDEEAENLSDDRFGRLIFEPGLSTASSLSSLAGRGLGMSIVGETVAALGGQVVVVSEPGQRTEIALVLPLSLAAPPLVLVSCGGQSFALPAHAVQSLYNLRLEELRVLGGRLLARLPDGEVEAVPLSILLGLPARPLPAAPGGTFRPAVALRRGERRLVLLVDALVETAVRPVVSLDNVDLAGELTASAALLDDGLVAFVLLPAALLARAATLPAAALPAAGFAWMPEPRAAPAVLVVDDSITTRTLEKAILEAHGYRVHLASDGAEAWDRLRGGLVADVVVTDLEMPRMDGFSLLETIRRDQRLGRLPVVLVTSRDSEEDRRQGVALGANAYIGKRHFSQRDLLRTIEELLGEEPPGEELPG